jgi:ankyrin repeat protein
MTHCRTGRLAAANGRPASVRTLLTHGADPTRRDTNGLSALEHCRHGRATAVDPAGHDDVEAVLIHRSNLPEGSG